MLSAQHESESSLSGSMRLAKFLAERYPGTQVAFRECEFHKPTDLQTAKRSVRQMLVGGKPSPKLCDSVSVVKYIYWLFSWTEIVMLHLSPEAAVWCRFYSPYSSVSAFIPGTRNQVLSDGPFSGYIAAPSEPIRQISQVFLCFLKED